MTPGTKLGPYEIVALLGAGGMGEVYRARDTKLKREVALKVLPEAFATDPERMARFQREAEVLASLNHPNIAQIYGVEDRALVMELVEGESPKGPMEFEEAWKIASQIAAGLEYAHDKGIVHRDLKPANIKVTADGVVKVLDFGLAKAFSGQTAASSNPENSPTLTLGATQLGVILGTAAYMAPEQAKGKTVDKRADIWSFGVVLYELLTGERLFTGDDVSDTLADVLKKEPNLDKVPIQARRLLRECLEKDPKGRLRDIGDAKRQLVEEASPAASARSRLGIIAMAAAVVFALLAGTLAWVHFREQSTVAEPVRFQIYPPDRVTIGPNMSLSPDGRKIVFQGTGADGVTRLWLRTLDSLETRNLGGTDGAASGAPFWSPDSRFIVFGAQNKLKKISVAGGPAQVLCDSLFQVGGGFWTPDGTIVFGGNPNLLRVSASGGPVSSVSTVEKPGIHALPSLLPDGHHFVYARAFRGAANSGIFIGSLDAKAEAQYSKRVLPDEATGPIYVPGASKETGYVLFVRDDTLMAQPLNNASMDAVGEPFPVAERVPSSLSHYWASPNGVLIYQAAGVIRDELTWYDRQGKVIGKVASSEYYTSVSISPEGDRILVLRRSRTSPDLYIVESARNTFTRFTFGKRGRLSGLTAWSPNGDSIAFSSGGDLLRKPSNGAGADEILLKGAMINDWSRDGKFLIYTTRDSTKDQRHLWTLGLTGERKPVKFIDSEFEETGAQFSPDGRWVAYTSDESGRFEVYVRPFPAADTGKWMVSQGGGYQPRWRRDGKELLYFSGNGTLMSSTVSASGTAFKAGAPTALFRAPVLNYGAETNEMLWDISPDGRRFLIITVPEQTVASPITVVLNWQAGLKK